MSMWQLTAQQHGEHVKESNILWEASDQVFDAVLAVLKAAEPNAHSTAALVRFLTSSISRCSYQLIHDVQQCLGKSAGSKFVRPAAMDGNT